MKKAVIVIIAIIIVALAYVGIKSTQSRQAANTTPMITNSQALAQPTSYQINGKDVKYFADVQGFYAAPSAVGNYPGVVMVHEWWGLNDQIKDTAKQLAGQGYRVLAVDLYNGKVAKTPADAQKYVAGFDKANAIANMQAAVDYLKAQGAPKVAALGWCFGGGQALQLSLSGVPLSGTIIYYGTPLVTDQAQLAKIKWPVLGVFGDKDQAIPVAKVQEFQTRLNELKIQNDINIYPGVGHAFANPSGQNYAPNETKDAWNKTLNFLQVNLKDT